MWAGRLRRVEWARLDEQTSGPMFRPGDRDFEAARTKPFIGGDADPIPQALLRAATTEDVVAAVRFVREHDLPFAVRSGGHCSIGTSSSTGLVLDLSGIAGVQVDGRRVTVGGGTKLGTVVERLAAYRLAIPTGTCPTVGVGGLTLGGGWGLLSRQRGLTCDALRAAQVVTATGDVLTGTEDDEPDLFWALRGGGAAGFGVVTRFVFEAGDAPVMSSFQYRWPFDRAAGLIERWQQWAVDAPADLSASLSVTAEGVKLHGGFVGTEDRARKTLGEFGAAPVEELVELDYLETARYHGRRIGEPPPGTHVYNASEFVDGLVPAEPLLEELSPGRELGFMPWGGAIAGTPPDATAFPHRQASFSVEHLALTPAADPEAHEWVRRQWQTAHPYGTGGVYANFQDAELDDWATAYYGANLPRLRAVKYRYDPDDLFHGLQKLTQS